MELLRVTRGEPFDAGHGDGAVAQRIHSEERPGDESEPLWPALAAGRLAVTDGFCSSERCYLEVVEVRPRRQPFGERTQDVLERVLLGQPQKSVAFECRRSPSTVAMTTQRCLTALGVGCSGAKVPVLLMMLVHEARLGRRLRDFRSSRVHHELGVRRLLSAARPDTALAPLLTRCENEVIRHLIEGKTYAEIAEARGTSARTVANQLARAYDRLGVSGRPSLVARLMEAHAGGGPLVAKRLPRGRS